MAKHSRHGNKNWQQGSASGEVWHTDYVRRKTKLERQLYQTNNDASEEQRKAYELLFGRSGFKPQNVCLVGCGGAGKTWIAKKLSNLLQCVFFNSGDVIRCAPLGRQACSFHPDARTIHSVIKLRPDARQRYPESLAEIQAHLTETDSDTFKEVKVFIVSEAFMCNSPHLEAILVHIKKLNPVCIFLFDGDCLQLAMKATPDYPGIPFLTRERFQEICPVTFIVFEKVMKYRMENTIKLAHMGKIRLGVATQETIDWLSRVKIPEKQQPVLRVFANAKPAATFNETQLTSILNRSKQKLTPILLQAEDFFTKSKATTQMSSKEDQMLSVDAVIKVVQGAPILIVQNHLAEKLGERQGQKVHVGNGTSGTFREYDPETDSIIVDIQFSVKKEYVRIKRYNFCTESKTRSQFPIMLAWAASIQKVQGMEFKFLEVDFCLNYYSTPSSGGSDFFQGCAYMVFTRAETVAVIGNITLPLINNVNSWCLQWWKSQISLWNDFKRGHSTQKPIFRNAIHQHNWHAGQLQKMATTAATEAKAKAVAEAKVKGVASLHADDLDKFELEVLPPLSSGSALPAVRPAATTGLVCVKNPLKRRRILPTLKAVAAVVEVSNSPCCVHLN